MTTMPIMHPEKWDDIELVVFDVDGTLYDQRRLRLLMARDLLLHAVASCDLRSGRILAIYRRLREKTADSEARFAEEALIADTAAAAGEPAERVRATVREWMAERPLRYLAGCRYQGVPELFAALKSCGKRIGILSDYPARAKLAALGLDADLVVSASDEGVDFLKPHPAGLEKLMVAAAVPAGATVLIGDRVERDGLAAGRAGARALIRSAKKIDGWQTFSRFDDRLFASLFSAPGGRP